MTTTYLLCPGIRNQGEAIDAWDDRAFEWLDSRRLRARVFPLDESGSVFRWFYEGGRTDKIAQLMDDQPDPDDVVYVAHSYGCHLGLRAACKAKHPPRTMHLIAGAHYADSNHSMLNEYLRRRPDARVCMWRGGRDRALKRAAPLSRVFSAGMLGYGSGGRIQPVANYKLDPAVESRVWFFDRDEFGHSDFLTPENLGLTLGRIAGYAPQMHVEVTRASEAA